MEPADSGEPERAGDGLLGEGTRRVRHRVCEAVRFVNVFVVQATIEEVLAALLDVERVAPCFPGAEVHRKSVFGLTKSIMAVRRI